MLRVVVICRASCIGAGGMQAGASWGNGRRCALPAWALTLGAAAITGGSGRQALPGHVPLSWALTLRLAVQLQKSLAVAFPHIFNATLPIPLPWLIVNAQDPSCREQKRMLMWWVLQGVSTQDVEEALEIARSPYALPASASESTRPAAIRGRWRSRRRARRRPQ